MYKVWIFCLWALPAIAQVRQNSIRLIPAPDNAQGTLEFQEQRPGLNVLQLRAPAAIANDVTWTLPATDGTNGQALVTNGSGVLSWGSSASQWTTSGTSIYYNGGPVGIGENTPSKGLLSVYGSNGYAHTPFNIVASARFRTGANSAILLGTTSANTSGWTRGMFWSFESDDLALSRFKDDESSGPQHDLYISTAGLVGINTTSPTEPLTVSGNIDIMSSGGLKIAGTTVINSSREANFNGLTLGGSISTTTTDTYDIGSSTRFRNIYGKSVNAASLEVANGTFVTTFWRHDLNGASTYRLSSGSGGQTEMQLATTSSTQSDVGFRGTVYPLSTAGTNGDLGTPSFPWKSLYLSTGLRLTAGAAAGRVLTSDASGNASWTVPAGGVTSIATSSPISGGTITTTGTISCPTCFTTAGGTMSGSILAATTDTYDIGSSTRFRNVYGKAMNTASLEVANGTFVTTFWRHDLNGAATYRLSSGSGGQTEMQLGTTSSTQSDAGFRGTIYPLSTAGSNGDIGTNSYPWKSLYLSTAAYMNGTQFIDSGRNLSNIGTITASSAITANGGILTGSATNSTIYIGGGNLYLRTFSGADATCSGVTNGWAGIRTDTDELQVCISGSVRKVSLL